MGFRLRRLLSFVTLGLAHIVSGLLGYFNGWDSWQEPSWKERPEPNAVLMLVSIRDVRRQQARLLGERVGSDAVSLYLIGAKVRADKSSGEFVLRGRSNSVIASLRPTERDGSRVIVDGPGLDGPTYALFRSRLIGLQ